MTANITKKNGESLSIDKKMEHRGDDDFFSFLKMGAFELIWAGEGVSSSTQSASNTTTEHETDMRDYLQQ